MIRNRQQFDLVQEQLGRATRALLSLERTVKPVNEERFELMAESYRDMIEQLQAQLDEYLSSEGARAGARGNAAE